MKVNEFIEKLELALKSNTVYCTGMFGNPITESSISQKTKQYPTSYNASKVASLKNLVGKGYFGFDCVCLIKGILWGWNANSNEVYGGAKYGSNNVSDVGTEAILNYCEDVSTDFKNIEVGEIVWIQGHVGVYVGNDEVIECTAKWDNRVLKSTLGNNKANGTKVRTWTKHGKLKWIEYPAPQTAVQKTNEEIAKEVLNGKWGNGAARKTRLTQAGYDYSAIQKIVNSLVSGKSTNKPAPTPAPTPKPQTTTDSLKVGAKIKIKSGAKDVNRKVKFASFVYKTTYYVKEIQGNKVIFTNIPNGKVATGVVDKSMITLA